MNPTCHDMNLLKRSMTRSFMDVDSFQFPKERITSGVPMFSSPLCSIPTDDLEPVPIGTCKTPYHQVAQQSMLKESIDFLFGSSFSVSKFEGNGAIMMSSNNKNKKRKRFDLDDLFDDYSSLPSREDAIRFRPYQNQQWCDRFEELKEFRRINGHCAVPYDHPANPTLARWVKRQRYQYKLYVEGRPSAMTEERMHLLEEMGFVWDTYMAAWERRMGELRRFQAMHGHANVPATYRVNRKLAAWVKCQRRQYKLFREGKPSTLTLQRVGDLNQLNFQWRFHPWK